MLPEYVMSLLDQLVKGPVVMNEQELLKANDAKYLVDSAWVEVEPLVWPSRLLKLKKEHYWKALRIVTWHKVVKFWKKHFSK